MLKAELSRGAAPGSEIPPIDVRPMLPAVRGCKGPFGFGLLDRRGLLCREWQEPGDKGLGGNASPEFVKKAWMVRPQRQRSAGGG
jgi:hypothetical protein